MSLWSELESALDLLSSVKTSALQQKLALVKLEKLFANFILSSQQPKALEHFVSLQDSFQYNITSRVVAWLSLQIFHLNKSSSEESNIIFSNIILALSLVQGLVLIHNSSKLYMSSKSSIEVLLELLLISRHKSSGSGSLTSSPKKSTNDEAVTLHEPNLASAILDTLLCVMVDSPPALRVFEAARGVETVVKLLKRAGIAREVRMKCLEFLYFYLLDETSTDNANFTLNQESQNDASILMQSVSAYLPSYSETPQSSPTKATRNPMQPRPVTLTRDEVGIVPLDPDKTQLDAMSNNSRFDISLSPLSRKYSESASDCDTGCILRTTEEKRNILVENLGNVDILIEGMKKAGIWGLG